MPLDYVSRSGCAAVCCSVLQCVAARHKCLDLDVLQCAAVCCSVLQCVAARHICLDLDLL